MFVQGNEALVDIILTSEVTSTPLQAIKVRSEIYDLQRFENRVTCILQSMVSGRVQSEFKCLTDLFRILNELFKRDAF